MIATLFVCPYLHTFARLIFRFSFFFFSFLTLVAVETPTATTAVTSATTSDPKSTLQDNKKTLELWCDGPNHVLYATENKNCVCVCTRECARNCPIDDDDRFINTEIPAQWLTVRPRLNDAAFSSTAATSEDKRSTILHSHTHNRTAMAGLEHSLARSCMCVCVHTCVGTAHIAQTTRLTQKRTYERLVRW